MKVHLLLVLALVLGIRTEAQTLKPKVDRAAYFDVSPPLRDMVKSLPQKADRTWKDGIVKNFFFNGPEHGSKNGSEPAADPGLQFFDGARLSDTTILNFEGVGNVNGLNPPDTDGDAGPDYYFQTINSSYAIFNKAGVKIFGPFTNSSVWNGMPNNSNDGDAIVLYDENADRWLFSQFSFPNFPNGPYFQMIAVSQTPDPTGAWYRWQFEFDVFNDYPKFGIWPDGYYMTCNHINQVGGPFSGNGAYAYDRDAMLAGDPGAQRISFTLPYGAPGFLTMLPSDCDGTFPPMGTPNYFAYIKTIGTQHFGIYEFHADWINPANATFGNKITLPVNSFSTFSGTGIAQKGTPGRLDPISDRLMNRLQYRTFNGYSAMVVNHTVKTTSNAAGIRWYELRNTGTGWSVYQQSTYAPSDNLSRWMASMAMDSAGSIALGFSISGSTMYPGIHYTGRLKNDPLNQMTISEKIIINGNGSQTGTGASTDRWGDYSTMRVDPTSPTTFWYSSEYYETSSGGNWKTRIASFTFGDVFSAEASATPSIICIGNTAQLDAIAYGGSSSYTYSWTSVPPGFTSTLKNPVVSPQQNMKYIVEVNDGSQIKTDSTAVTVNQPPVAFAGNDTVVCWYVSQVGLQGVAEHYKLLSWQTSGDGTFSDPSSATTQYSPGMNDKTSGGADLALIALPLAPCQGNAVSALHITFDPCTGVDPAGPDQITMKISPNPAQKQVVVTFSNITKPVDLTLFNPGGQAVYHAVVPGNQASADQRIDLNGFPDGTYIIQMKTENEVKSDRLMIINK
jgi:hypothetical protein